MPISNYTDNSPSAISNRFRGYLPVVVDVETAGFNHQTDALLEIAAVLLRMNEKGQWERDKSYFCHVMPFEGANIEKAALEFTGIDPYHPFRFAVSEEEALKTIFQPIRQALRETRCTRAILVGHNPSFDLNFLKAAAERAKVKRNPFHPFSTFDTASLAGLAFGQTVLAKAMIAAGLNWDGKQAHSAQYDAEQTADLFCKIVNMWGDKVSFRQQGDTF
jgi:ribonuclease T